MQHRKQCQGSNTTRDQGGDWCAVLRLTHSRQQQHLSMPPAISKPIAGWGVSSPRGFMCAGHASSRQGPRSGKGRAAGETHARSDRSHCHRSRNGQGQAWKTEASAKVLASLVVLAARRAQTCSLSRSVRKSVKRSIASSSGS